MVLAHPPGTDPATEALRQSLMGVAAIHRAFLLAKTGISDAADETMSTAKSFRRAATQCLTTALTTPRGFESNAALCASVTVALIDVRVSHRYETCQKPLTCGQWLYGA